MTKSAISQTLSTAKTRPDNAPVLAKGRISGLVTRFMGRVILKLMGYKIVGQFPNEKKMVIIAAPHTSNWDLFLAFGTMLSLGVKISYVMKKEAFFFPFKTIFMAMGGLPVDRSNPKKAVLTALKAFRDQDKFWLAVLPEGTRKPATVWKTGFSRIATKAGVPIFMIGVDHPNKTLVLDRMFEAQDNASHQAQTIQQYTQTKFSGINPKNN